MIQISIKNGRDRFWQWDVNQQLVIRGVADTFHVHYEQEGIAKPLPVLPVKQADGSFLAPVPNILLQNAEEVTVYVYHTGTDEQYTQTFKRFYVVPREKPAEYIYTETELVTWEGMAQQCNAMLREAQAVLDLTDTAAGDAEEAAHNAQEAADTAEGKAVEASEQAALAAKSAEDAATRAAGLQKFAVNTVEEMDALYNQTVDAADNAEASATRAHGYAELAQAAAEDRAGVIALDASGATVTLPDSAERPMRALTVDITASLNGWSGATVTVQNEAGSATHSVDFGREVYGGRYDWRTGELTVTHKGRKLTGEEDLYETTGKPWMHRLIVADLKKGTASDLLAVSSHYKASSEYWSTAGSGAILTSNDVLLFCDAERTNDELRAYWAEQYAAGTPVVVVYELATPEVVQLEPSALPSTLYPSTTVFADTGDVALTYAADTKNYIDRRIRELIGG